MSREWRIRLAQLHTTAVFEPSPSGDRLLLVLAHGAGGHRDHPGMRALSGEFQRRGIAVVRFNFPYRENSSGAPDRMPVLKQCMAAVIEHARAEIGPQRLVIGGRSMGGRVASVLAAEGSACEGVLLLGYPLHPAGKPEQLRDADLHQIRVPVLCLNGTRDALCRRELMERSLERLSGSWTQHWIEAADHSFHVTRGSGRTDSEVLAEIGAATAAWISKLPTRKAA